MTTPPAEPPLAPDELVATGTEREVLEAFLDFYRGVIVRKASGLAQADTRQRLVPSKTTLAGLIKHLIGVERGWFQHRLAGRTPEAIGPNWNGSAESWELTGDDTVAARMTRSRSCQASGRPAGRPTRRPGGPRWVWRRGTAGSGWSAGL